MTSPQAKSEATSKEPVKLTEQQFRVVNYLATGSTLTNVVALTCLGVKSLSSRISELRKLGFVFEERNDRDQHGQLYKKYDLQLFADQPAFIGPNDPA